MNRAQRRAEEAREKMQRNAQKVRAIVDERNELALASEQLKMLLFAVARREGRLIVRRDEIKDLGENDRVDFMQRDNGDVVVEYTKG